MPIVVNSILTIKSPAFKDKGFIPLKYTCDGANVNPELSIDNLPNETKSLALIVDDPDAPMGSYVHWIMWNIPPKNKIEEDSAPGIEGKNQKGRNKYSGPCPPSVIHNYHFRIYALDTELDLPLDSDKQKLITAMEGHILGTGEIVGLYKGLE